MRACVHIPTCLSRSPPPPSYISHDFTPHPKNTDEDGLEGLEVDRAERKQKAIDNRAAVLVRQSPHTCTDMSMCRCVDGVVGVRGRVLGGMGGGLGCACLCTYVYM